MGIESQFIWMNGQMLPYEKATVHFLNMTLHYGVGAFEGIRCYDTPRGPAVFRLSEHMQRLIDSTKVIGFNEFPYTVEELSQAVRDVVKANGLKECYIRPLVYLNSPGLGLNLAGSSVQVGIAAWEWGNFLGEDALEKGIRANIASFTRHHPNVSMTKAKITGNYANSMLAKTESVRLGFEEAIMLDPQGFIAECTGENIFLVRGGKLYTTPTATILEGITRTSLLTIAADLGYTVIEQPISRDQLYIADEVFVCGSAAEVIAIREVDFRRIGSGVCGPVTRVLQKGYHAAIHGEDERYGGWLDLVG
ncbi:MAG: branched chain amino acid aminotransferase [Chloroflexi bacterium HGW-Chloroflexi-10]|nr:MAG: branched chain amino acid aminotransferase [Chloroflexi bacterium HGW-Chloroflexi-10]